MPRVHITYILTCVRHNLSMIGFAFTLTACRKILSVWIQTIVYGCTCICKGNILMIHISHCDHIFYPQILLFFDFDGIHLNFLFNKSGWNFLHFVYNMSKVESTSYLIDFLKIPLKLKFLYLHPLFIFIFSQYFRIFWYFYSFTLKKWFVCVGGDSTHSIFLFFNNPPFTHSWIETEFLD